ncbi:MAG: MFS transporter [Candidatus Avigastranaerophilus sp.]
MNLYRALKYRNCRLFFSGLFLSQIGIWFQNITISWLILEMTKSPLIMGFVTFINALPLFFLTPLAGVITDKYNKKKLLFTVQILLSIQALLITAAAVTGHLNLSNIIILGLLLNSIIAIDTPIRQSSFTSLVDDKKDLSNAIAINSACFNAARLIGPAIAGILLALYGTKICLFMCFLLVLPAIILISMLKPNINNIANTEKQSIIKSLKEGLVYVKNDKTISLILVFLIFICFFGMTYPVLMPIYTKNTFNANAGLLGFLMAATGFGALFSSFVLASKTSLSGLKNTMLAGIILFGCGFLFLGLSKIPVLSIIFAFVLGAGMTASITGINTILQQLADDNKRGRLMSLYTICYLGSASISNLLAGTVSEFLGVEKTFILLGLLIVLTGIILYKKLRA